MRNIKKKLSALVMTAVFASMQLPTLAVLDTGLGAGNGGAVINNATGGFNGVQTGTNSATLNFTGHSHVNWNTLNVNSGETLNFNAINGAKGITVLNTVNQGMSKIYGNINANSGVGKLIISNPNGVLFDGAKFTTAGDAMITTQGANMNVTTGAVTFDAMTVPEGYVPNGEDYVVKILNSDFSVGGELNVIAPTMNIAKSTFNANNGAGDVRLTTTNGQDYFVTKTGCCSSKEKYTETQSMRLEAIQVDGDVYIVSDKGIVKTVQGGNINGDLNIKSNGTVSLNYNTDGAHTFTVKGDVNAKANGPMMYARNVDVKGNLNMTNGGGFLEVRNSNIGKDMNLTTVAESENPLGYKHFTHVSGEVNVGGNANLNSKNNIHIGNYNYDTKEALPGNLKVGGNLTAHADEGHVMTTINVQADKIDYTSDKLNVLTDDKAVLTANEYKFKSNGYIGGLQDYTKEDGSTLTVGDQVVGIMENYIYIPHDIKSHAYTKIAGGNITNIETPKDSTQVYIGSYGDVKLTGANAGDINLTAFRKRIDITGDVHADNINVGPETDYLKLDFPGRDFTTNFTNIRDEKVVTVKPDEVITYELTDGAGGHNQPTLKPAEKTTYLIGPGKEEPQPEPVNPNEPNRYAPGDDNVRVWNQVPDDPMRVAVNTPVAFAADLDDEEAAGVRKNVDGSVTVVRAFPMGK